jgi:site-specific DNA recombinase
MRVAVYARVSTTRQAQAQTIEQQLDRLRAAVAERGWVLDGQHVYRDDGYSGAGLGRPGLDRLRDHAALADLDVVLVTAPDRLARNYVHQVLLIEELAGHGCQMEFLDRPMSNDPHDQLLLQIRGAVAEYERTLIAERMRRGRLAKLRAGALLPWTRPPFGYRVDPERPRDAAAVRVEPGEAVLVAQLFDWYLEPQATLYRLARRLTGLGVATPTGKPRWNVASVRWILRNPAYAGRALTNRTRVVPARQRKSAMQPAGPGLSHAPRPPEDWIEVPVPQIVSGETFAQVQAKLDVNQQSAARNTRHEYLLRALVSCGACRLSCTARQSAAGYRYYLCRGHTDALRAAQGQRCSSRYIPAGQLDELVWADLCALLTDPAQVTHALQRARSGAWLPQELQARQAAIRQALGQLDRQQQRLLDAYLAEVVGLPELERKRQELDRRHATLLAQQCQLEAAAQQRLELTAVAGGIEAFCQTVRAGLATATFTQRRQLAELLIDRVIVTGSDIEIRYVLPTSPDGPHRPFCQLRKDHLELPPLGIQPSQVGRGCLRRVQDGGDQPVDGGRPGQRVFDDPHPGRVSVPVLVAGSVDVAEAGTIAQLLHHGQHGGVLDPPQQVRAGSGGGPPQVKAGEPAVGDQQHPCPQLAQQPPGQHGLMHRQRPQLRGEHGMRAALAQRSDPDLREGACARSAWRPRPAKETRIGRGIGHIERGAIHRDQPPGPVERPGCGLGGQRLAYRGEQRPQRLGPQPGPRPRDRRRGRHPPAPLPPPRIGQSLGQQPGHLLIPLAEKQAHRQHVINHHPRWQQPAPPLHPPRLRHHPVHQLRRERHRQKPNRDPVRQPLTGRRLHLPSTRHPGTLPGSQLKSAVLGLDP